MGLGNYKITLNEVNLREALCFYAMAKFKLKAKQIKEITIWKDKGGTYEIGLDIEQDLLPMPNIQYEDTRQGDVDAIYGQIEPETVKPLDV